MLGMVVTGWVGMGVEGGDGGMGMDLRDSLCEGYSERHGDGTPGFATGVVGGPGYY